MTKEAREAPLAQPAQRRDSTVDQRHWPCIASLLEQASAARHRQQARNRSREREEEILEKDNIRDPEWR
jgi:hypothetical protein